MSEPASIFNPDPTNELKQFILQTVMGAMPHVAFPYSTLSVTQVNADGTVKGKKSGEANANGFNYSTIQPLSPDRPAMAGDELVVHETPDGRPFVTGVLSKPVSSNTRFTAPVRTVNMRTQYGCDPTGQTSINTQVNQAVTDFAGSGGVNMYFDSGTYGIDGTSGVPWLQDDQWITGDGPDKTIFQPFGGPAVNPSGNQLFKFGGSTCGMKDVSLQWWATGTMHCLEAIGSAFGGFVMDNVLLDGTNLCTNTGNIWLYIDQTSSGNALLHNVRGRPATAGQPFIVSSHGQALYIKGLPASGMHGCKLTDCDLGGDVYLDGTSDSRFTSVTSMLTITAANSTYNDFLLCQATGFTENGTADNNQLIYTPVTNTLTLVGAHSFSLGPNNGGTAGLRVDVGSSYSPPLLTLNKTGTNEFSVDASGNVTAAGNVTHGLTMMSRVRQVNVTAQAVGTHGPYGAVTGVPSGAKALWAFVTTNNTTAGAQYTLYSYTGGDTGIATGYAPIAASYGAWTLIPLDANGQFGWHNYAVSDLIVDVYGFLM